MGPWSWVPWWGSPRRGCTAPTSPARRSGWPWPCRGSGLISGSFGGEQGLRVRAPRRSRWILDPAWFFTGAEMTSSLPRLLRLDHPDHHVRGACQPESKPGWPPVACGAGRRGVCRAGRHPPGPRPGVRVHGECHRCRCGRRTDWRLTYGQRPGRVHAHALADPARRGRPGPAGESDRSPDRRRPTRLPSPVRDGPRQEAGLSATRRPSSRPWSTGS